MGAAIRIEHLLLLVFELRLVVVFQLGTPEGNGTLVGGDTPAGLLFVGGVLATIGVDDAIAVGFCIGFCRFCS